MVRLHKLLCNCELRGYPKVKRIVIYQYGYIEVEIWPNIDSEEFYCGLLVAESQIGDLPFEKYV